MEVSGRGVKRPRELTRRRQRPARQWARRDKAPACMLANFPWEVIFRRLSRHPRSLILMQMVDKNLAQRLGSDHELWAMIFKRDLYSSHFATVQVRQTRFPNLKLFKAGLSGVPVHVGPMRGDPTERSLPEGFDGVFTKYMRQAYALQHGHRCGLCGCRWHHEPYWSLRMRVCRLCMAGNLVSSWELLDRYGVHYSDVARRVGGGRVFYFLQQFAAGQDRNPVHGAMPLDIQQRRHMWVFWRPHLEKVLDLPALYVAQPLRKEAGLRLCAVFRRARVWSLRCEYGKQGACRHRSVDRMIMTLYREERLRQATLPWGCWRSEYPSVGGPDWAFSCRAHCGVSRQEHLWGESKHAVGQYMQRWEDSGPGTLEEAGSGLSALALGGAA